MTGSKILALVAVLAGVIVMAIGYSLATSCLIAPLAFPEGYSCSIPYESALAALLFAAIGGALLASGVLKMRTSLS
jgi:hypothetical protein